MTGTWNTKLLILLILTLLCFSCGTKEARFFSFHSLSAKTGPYGRADLDRDWNAPKWENGVSQGLVSIVDDSDERHRKAMRVLFPKGSYSNSTTPGKTQWIVELGKGFDEVYCAYDVKFGNEFNFVKGGKIHGLAGGKRNAGGRKPNGLDGWSSRVVWLADGKLGQYVYHPDQTSNYGQVFKYTLNGDDVVVEQGRWYNIVNRVVMNTPKKHDGVVQAWVDDKLVLDIRNIRFRDTDSIRIDSFYFTTFFGGDDETWAASRDEHIFFDNFVINPSPRIPH